MKTSLKSSEWLLIGSLILIMSSLVVISKVNAYRASAILAACPEEILVAIRGAVQKPGEYRVAAGTLVGEVVRKARPTKYANLEKLPLKEAVNRDLELVVEEFSEITVHIGGAVAQPMELTLPVRARICDLKSKIVLTSDADRGFFRRKRLLKNGEKIEVPKKTVE